MTQRVQPCDDYNRAGDTVKVVLEADGFQVCQEDAVQQVPWADVREIVTYKEDLLSYDNICLAFRLSDEDDWLVVDEEGEGFKDLAEAMKKQFPNVPSDWHSEVMFPAFVTNYRVLWNQEKATE